MLREPGSRDRGEGFDRPLAPSRDSSRGPSRGPSLGGADRGDDRFRGGGSLVAEDHGGRVPAYDETRYANWGGREEWRDRHRYERRSRTSVTINIGLGGGWIAPPAPVWRGSSFCYYDSWFHSPRWSCGPTFYTSFSFGDCDRWWWGSRYRWSSYHGWRPSPYWHAWRYECDWLYDFRFCAVPTYSVRYTTLVCPSVVEVPVYRPVYVASAPVVVETGPIVIERPVVVRDEPVLASAEPLPRVARPEELLSTSDRELGDTYLKLGDAENATRVYRDHLARFPGDARAGRSLGLALLLDRRPDEAFREIERAYRIDPGLASRPVRSEQFGDAYAFRRVLDDAARAADKSDTPGAWLTVAVLMQADGRADAARSAIGRARAAGLDNAVVDAMRGVIPE